LASPTISTHAVQIDILYHSWFSSLSPFWNMIKSLFVSSISHQA
jgi:hypothetical protein